MPSKTTASKTPAKAASKKAAPEKKAPAKAAKTASQSEKKAPRKNLNESVGFVYGGDVIKVNHVFVFQCNEKDPTQYVTDNLVQYYGPTLSGRYVKCEDAQTTFDELLAQAGAHQYQLADGSYIFTCSVQNGSNLLKEVSGQTTAHTIKLGADEDKPAKAKKTPAKGKKAAPKKAAKKSGTAEASEAEDEEEENVEDDKEVDEEEAGDAEDADEADEAPADEEEEEKAPVKKNVAKER